MTTYISLDTETAGLEARYDKNIPIWCYSIQLFNGESWEGSTEEWNDVSADYLRELAEREDVVWFIHNASYDVAVLRQHGVYIRPGSYHDTMLMSYLLNPGSEGHSLDDHGQRLGNAKMDYRQALIDLSLMDHNDPKGFQFLLHKHRDFTSSMMVCKSYCEQDARITYQLGVELLEKIQKDNKLWKCYTNLELPYVEVIIELETTGLPVNVNKLRTLQAKFQRDIDRLTDELNRLVPFVPEVEWKDGKFVAKTTSYAKGYNKNKLNADRYYTYDGVVVASDPAMVYEHVKLVPFNPNSSDHLAWALMREGWKPTVFNKGDSKPTCNAEIVDALTDDYELAKLYGDINELSKLNSTFVSGLLNGADRAGFVHGSYNQCITKTTRLSSSNPNLQNLPSRTELGSSIRDCVEAPTGYTLVVGDLDQIEIRVLAYYLEKVCGEKRMGDAARAGQDAHQANADAWGVDRKKAKTGVFAVNYGAMAERLSTQLKCSVEEAQSVIDAINNGMPAIQQLKDSVWRSARNRDGYVYDLLGHRLYYPDIVSSNKWDRQAAERQCFNAVIQSSAGAIFKELTFQAMYLSREFGARMVGVVHDELLLIVPDEHVQELCDNLDAIFNNHTLLGTDNFYVPVTAKFNPGNNWNEAKNA